MPSLRAAGIGKRVGNHEILRDVSLELKAGEVVALIGPSGCGKTTLLRALSLVSPPTSGKLAIGDREFDCDRGVVPPWQQIYPELTVVFQQFALWPHLRIRDNLALPAKVRGESFPPGFMSDLCSELGITACLDRYPSELSVGQRQRSALARALLVKPRWLLLDEVTSAQDVEHIKVIMHVVRRVSREGAGVIVATHLIGFARRLASRFYFLDNGVVIEDGSVSLLGAPRSQRMKDFLLVSDEI